MSYVPGMSGMGRRARCDCAVEAAGRHGVRRCPADAGFGFIAERIDAAWALEAVAATKTGFAEAALRDHFLVAVPDGLNPHGLRFADHLLNGWIQALVPGHKLSPVL
jgi:hypothetical protein